MGYELPMGRGKATRVHRRFFFCQAAVMVAAAIPAVASADVMEIDANGYSWVAGGPKTRDPANAIAEPAETPIARSLTEVGKPAGPAQWQSYVADVAAKYEISPALLEAVVWQESRWNAAAVSPAGARGLAQLMPATARQMGVDTRDPGANLEGGARYLRHQLDAFSGDLEKALAAYNAGPARVQAAGGVPAIRETQDYVSSILGRLAAPVRK
jgi:soluble lytic murein transglycosylase-like protein